MASAFETSHALAKGIANASLRVAGAPVFYMYTLYLFMAAYDFQFPSRPLVGKTTKLQAEMQ